MFGLMRAKKCGQTAEEKNFRRLNYCGTCKTIGSVYGQKARSLLNYDTVFLAEILTAVSGEEVNGWHNSYQSYNCLNLPPDDLPVSLQFAAAANLILTRFKLSDHIKDEKKARYRFAEKAFAGEFEVAAKYLKDLNFPLAEVEDILQRQERTEAGKGGPDDFAGPTAAATAIFFSEGVRATGRSDLRDPAYRLGSAFGKLIYFIDAFEDYESDVRKGGFNAFQAAFDLREKKLSPALKRRIRAIIGSLEREIIENIYQLPLTIDQKKTFAVRLAENVGRKLKTDLPVFRVKRTCAKTAKPKFSERWKNALARARDLAGNYSWQMPAVFLFVLVFALVAPAQTREARSARECFDLGFNLMFLGGLFGSVVAAARPVLTKGEGGGRLYPDIPTDRPKGTAPVDDKSSWCDWCDCCDCGECCCDCGIDGICDSCCDGCDCCDCCSCDC